jgi:hypothetical protein
MWFINTLRLFRHLGTETIERAGITQNVNAHKRVLI